MSSPIHDIERRGARMPSLGFGTFRLKGDTVRRMVETALEMGYRHVDTAQVYANEAEVGAAIAASGVPREDVFLTTKVWEDRFAPGDLEASIGESLDRLGTEYADLVLLHWPTFPDGRMKPVLESLMAVQDAGRARHIGLSNFNIAQLEEAEAICGPGRLAANQVEYHVYLGQARLREAMERMGMILTAYLPLARGRVAADPALSEIGARHGKTAAQVALRWLVEKPGVAAIPATTNADRCRENMEIFDFELTDADRRAIAALDKASRFCSPSGLAPAWDD